MQTSSLSSRLMSFCLSAWIFLGLLAPYAAQAAGTAVRFNTSSGVVAGRVSILATASTDSNSSLSMAGISILGKSNYSITLNGHGTPDYAAYRFNSSIADYAWNASNGDYSFNLDTTSWDNGNYQIIVFTKDSSGNSAETTPITITTANGNPTIALANPINPVAGRISITATALTDSRGTATLAYAGIKISGLSNYAITMSGHGTPDYAVYRFDSGIADYAWSASNSDYTFNFDTTSWPNGTYQVTVFTKDNNARSAASQPILITTNNANPTVTINSPSSTAKGRVNVFATALTDPRGTATLSHAGIKITGISNYAITMTGHGTPDYSAYRFDSALADFAWSASNSDYGFTFDTTAWPNGKYEITVYTRDSNGRTAQSSPISLTTANGNPTVIISSKPGAVKGQTSILATALPDAGGTATLAYAGIDISGLSNYQITMTGHGTPDYSAYRFDNDIADFAWSASNSDYVFNFDTTQWPSGSYTVTVYTKDSNGRTAKSEPLSIIMPKSITLSLVQLGSSGLASTFSVLSSDNKVFNEGELIIAASQSETGPFLQIAKYPNPENDLNLRTEIPFGTWVRAEYSKSSYVYDSKSNPIQVIGKANLLCIFKKVAKAGSKVSGSCSSDIEVSNLPIQLESNSGSGWRVIANGFLNGKSLSPSVIPNKIGRIQVRLVSLGRTGYYATSTSNISTIQVTKTGK